jgi:hypothetical protein
LWNELSHPFGSYLPRSCPGLGFSSKIIVAVRWHGNRWFTDLCVWTIQRLLRASRTITQDFGKMKMWITPKSFEVLSFIVLVSRARARGRIHRALNHFPGVHCDQPQIEPVPGLRPAAKVALCPPIEVYPWSKLVEGKKER